MAIRNPNTAGIGNIDYPLILGSPLVVSMLVVSRLLASGRPSNHYDVIALTETHIQTHLQTHFSSFPHILEPRSAGEPLHGGGTYGQALFMLGYTRTALV